MRTLLYLSGWMRQLPAQTHRHLMKWELNFFSKLELLALEVRALPYHHVAICRPDNKHNRCRTGEDSECEVEKKLLSRRCQRGIVSF